MEPGSIAETNGHNPTTRIKGTVTPVGYDSTALAALPHRGALLCEGAGAFPGVHGGHDGGHERGHPVPSLLGGPVAAAGGDLLGGDQGERAVGRDPFGQFDRCGERLAVVDHAVDQPDLGGPGGVDRVAG